jgi:hypothetical protein
MQGAAKRRIPEVFKRAATQQTGQNPPERRRGDFRHGLLARRVGRGHVTAADRATRYLAALALLSLAGLPACKGKKPSGAKRPEPPGLGTITILPIPAVEFRGQTLQLEETPLAKKVKDLLVEAGIFAEPGPGQARVFVAVEAEPFTAGNADDLEMGVKLHLRMTIRPEGAAEARFAEDAMAVGQAPLATREAKEAQDAFARLVLRTAEDLVSTYVGRQKLWSAGAKEVESALSSADNELRAEALRVIGTRKLRELLPAVLRLLADEDEAVRDAALGTVVALNERSAVKALAESRQMRDLREMRKVLDAIASLGGAEAKQYLGFVAENHDDEEIRVMAKAALERMSRRDGHDRPTR